MRSGDSSAATAAYMMVGVVALTASSYVAIPTNPVPITLQTLAVTLIGALLGARLGAITVIAWLALGALGLPVLAGGGSGLARFTGASAGYLFAFPFAAALVGALARGGWSRRFTPALIAMLLGNALCLAGGAAWLALRIGVAPAITGGVLPFLPGALFKSALGALLLLARRARRRRRRRRLG